MPRHPSRPAGARRPRCGAPRAPSRAAGRRGRTGARTRRSTAEGRRGSGRRGSAGGTSKPGSSWMPFTVPIRSDSQRCCHAPPGAAFGVEHHEASSDPAARSTGVNPRRRRWYAAERPAWPAPMTTTSTSRGTAGRFIHVNENRPHAFAHSAASVLGVEVEPPPRAPGEPAALLLHALRPRGRGSAPGTRRPLDRRHRRRPRSPAPSIGCPDPAPPSSGRVDPCQVSRR